MADLDLDAIRDRCDEVGRPTGDWRTWADRLAASQADVPALVDELERLRQHVDDQQELADQFVNDLLEFAPDHYDDDVAAEAIALRYLRDLEAEVGPLRAERTCLHDALYAISVALGLQDVPTLVAEVERLRSVLGTLKPALDEHVAEVERLQAAVALHRPLTTLIGIERCAECGRRWLRPGTNVYSDAADALDAVAELQAEARRLRAAVALHQPVESPLDADGEHCAERCAECDADWPCPTIRTASGEDDRG